MSLKLVLQVTRLSKKLLSYNQQTQPYKFLIMKNNIRTKMVLISLLTLTVAVGGSMLYVGLLNDMKLEAYTMNKGIYIVSSPRINSSGVQSGRKITNNKLSGRLSSAQPKPMNMDVRRDNSLLSGMPASRSSLALSSSFSGQSVTKRKSKDDFNSGGGTGMISQIQATGRSRSSFLSSEGTYGGSIGRTSLSSDYASATGNLTAPLLANGLDGDGDDPSDELPPPVGAPVGGGFWILLLMALGYMGWWKEGPPTPPEASGRGRI